MSSETIFEYVAFTNSKCYWLRFEVNYQHLPHCINKTSYTFKCYADTELLDKIVETSQPVTVDKLNIKMHGVILVCLFSTRQLCKPHL